MEKSWEKEEFRVKKKSFTFEALTQEFSFYLLKNVFYFIQQIKVPLILLLDLDVKGSFNLITWFVFLVKDY